MSKTRITAAAIAIVLAVMMLLAPWQPTFAENYTVTEISPDRGYDPRLNDWGDAIWVKSTQFSDGTNQIDLVYYDSSLDSRIAVSSQMYDNRYVPLPVHGIANNGDAAWDIRLPGEADLEIFIYNRQSGNTRRVTDNDYPDAFYKINDRGDVLFVSHVPAAPGSPERYELNVYISGGTIVNLGAFDPSFGWPWEVNWNGDAVYKRRETSPYYRNKLYLYRADINTYQELTAPDASVWDGPQMNATGDVVWVETRGWVQSPAGYYTYTSGGVSLYDRDSGGVTDLSSYPYPIAEYEPLVSDNGNVIWTGGPASEYDIYYYDAARNRVTQLTQTPYPGYGYWDKDINANGDACWVDWSPPAGQRKVYVYNAKAGTISMIDGIHDQQDWPQINNYRDVVFEAGSSGSRVVVLARTEYGGVERGIASLTQRVDSLVVSGGVDPAVAADLNQLLTMAEDYLRLGDIDKASHSLDKFKDRVAKEEDKGNITPVAADALTTEAQRLIEGLSP